MLLKFYILSLNALLLITLLPAIAAKKIATNAFPKTHFTTLINLMEQQLKFETLLLIEHPAQQCLPIKELITQSASRPKLILNGHQQNLALKKLYNSRMLLITCLQVGKEISSLSSLTKILTNLRGTPMIIQLTHANPKQLTQIFNYLWNQRLLHVIVLLQDYQTTGNYYSYQPFPVLQVEQLQFDTTAQYFPQRMQQLKGYPLRTFPDQMPPHTILERDRYGDIHMLGYVGRIIETFAWKLNATLTFAMPVEIGTAFFYSEILALMRNESLDVPASIARLNDHFTLPTFSHFVEIGQSFPMVPLAAQQPTPNIYALFFNSELGLIFLSIYWSFAIMLTLSFALNNSIKLHKFLLHLVLHEKSFLGNLGISFSYQPRNFSLSGKLVYVLLAFSGLFFNTCFNAFLSTYITQVPSEAEFNSFEDLKQRGMKILLPAPAMRLVANMKKDPKFQAKYVSLFEGEKNVTQFESYRAELNQSTAFSVVSSQWAVIEQQQRYFAKKLFRRSPTLSFSNYLLFVFPLQEDSIFEAPLNDLLMQLHASGIFAQWYHSSFYDMIKAGLMSFKDLSHARSLRAAQVRDFYWIGVFYFMGVLAGTLSFIFELVYV